MSTRAGSRKPKRRWRGASKRGWDAARAAERVLWEVAIFAGGVEAPLGAQCPLGERSCDEDQHDAGDLRCASEAIAVEPGIVDSDPERSDPEQLDRADVVERIHQRKRGSCGESGTGKRQRHPPEGLGHISPERTPQLEHADRLRDEARPRGDVAIRIGTALMTRIAPPRLLTSGKQ
jgi:hypothetical protein